MSSAPSGDALGGGDGADRGLLNCWWATVAPVMTSTARGADLGVELSGTPGR